jgi:hypothetical protein
MDYRIIEATQADEPFNWGKFLITEFDDKAWDHISAINARPLLPTIGYVRRRPGLWVLDLQTREGAYFYPDGSAIADLNKTRIWTCPLFEPFLLWLYENYEGSLVSLPNVVYLNNAPAALAVPRRAGDQTSSPTEVTGSHSQPNIESHE